MDKSSVEFVHAKASIARDDRLQANHLGPFDSLAYAPRVVKTDLDTCKQLLATPEPPSLGPERRSGTLSESDVIATLQPMGSQARLSARRDELIQALLLLWHDHLDSAHALAQTTEDANGNFVHAIMHRREPDAWNSKYWWRRVGDHPAFPELARRVDALLGLHGDVKLARRLLPGGHWDPAAFVDACVATLNSAYSDPTMKLLREIQREETEILLEHLFYDTK